MNVLKVYAEIFTACLAIGYFPKNFKRTRVVMIPKPGKKNTMVENYQPLRLLEVPAKLLERIIVPELQ